MKQLQITMMFRCTLFGTVKECLDWMLQHLPYSGAASSAGFVMKSLVVEELEDRKL